jgi:hypothetical protein
MSSAANAQCGHRCNCCCHDTYLQTNPGAPIYYEQCLPKSCQRCNPLNPQSPNTCCIRHHAITTHGLCCTHDANYEADLDSDIGSLAAWTHSNLAKAALRQEFLGHAGILPVEYRPNPRGPDNGSTVIAAESEDDDRQYTFSHAHTVLFLSSGIHQAKQQVSGETQLKYCFPLEKWLSETSAEEPWRSIGAALNMNQQETRGMKKCSTHGP